MTPLLENYKQVQLLNVWHRAHQWLPRVGVEGMISIKLSLLCDGSAGGCVYQTLSSSSF